MKMTVDHAVELARTHFGMDATATELASEWGGTFRLATEGGTQYILKVAPDHVEEGLTDLELSLIRHLATSDLDLRIPHIHKAIDGKDLQVTPFGRARLYSWIEGRLWVDVNPHSVKLLRSLGTSLGKLKTALEGFDHPAAHREFSWAPSSIGWLRNEAEKLKARRENKEDEVTGLIEFVVEQVGEVEARIERLEKGVNYNDCNDHNVLVASDVAMPEVIGFIDFGDVHYGPKINDLAVCLAYAMMGHPDPVGAAVEVVTGYHREVALSESELEVLLPLAMSRSAISLVHAELRREKDPDNEYWQVSAGPAFELLSRLAEYPLHLALCRLRHACGFEPSPNAEEVRNWLSANVSEIHPITGFDLKDEQVEVFDWSVSSLAMGTFADIADVERATVDTFRQMAKSGTRVGIGRYNEPRAVYTTDEYLVPGNNGGEMRTVHIGVDIFMPAGTALYAPLDGTVFAIVNDEGDKEYGPLLVLEHGLNEGGLVFYTLYGHNNLQTLDMWQKGDRVNKGEKICEIGPYPENGNWVPHSHFQIMTDMLGYTDDFPGVALASQRDVWLSLCPDPNLMLGISHPELRPPSNPVQQLLQARSKHIGRNLSITYSNPLHVVRGCMSRLYTEDGTSYLDTANNIAHVGHEHPAVVRAGKEQMAVLNTNTRYLHRNIIELGEKLLATLPDHLTRIYFVNSGSEANDLAMRIARLVTGNRETLIMFESYHGITEASLEISSHKFNGKGGQGARPFIHTLPEISGGQEASIAEAIKVAEQLPDRPLFIHESLPSCAGQIVPPRGYFEQLYSIIRGKQGVCIADEVQTGLGRVGDEYWSFELYGIQPDMVTIGKPLGNGHPVAAVAMSEELADAFDNGMEFFSSFGGNPVSCAIAGAVLDVIEREQLQQHAMEMGMFWKSQLSDLQKSSPIISEIRGHGLFLGIEFQNPESGEPATAQAKYVQQRMLDHRILTSLDGPGVNVMKLKPPMSITREEIDLFNKTLGRILREDYVAL